MDIEERLKGLATQFSMDIGKVQGIYNKYMQDERLAKFSGEQRAKIALLFTRQELIKLKASATINFIPIGMFVERQYGTDVIGFSLKSDDGASVEPFVLTVPAKYQKFVDEVEFFSIYSLSYRDNGRMRIYTSAEFLRNTNVADEVAFVQKFWNVVELNGLSEAVSREKRCDDACGGGQIPDPTKKLLLFTALVERKRKGVSRKGTGYVLVEVSDETLPITERVEYDEHGTPVVLSSRMTVWLHQRFDVVSEGDIVKFLGTIQRGDDGRIFANACNVWIIE